MEPEHLLQIPDLKWLPWIGEKYFSMDPKILIVGESHYAKNDPETIKAFDRREITIECVEDMGVSNNKYDVKFYQNIHSLLVQNKTFDTEVFWSRVGFYNFIQKTMITKHTRPEYMDYHNSAHTFYNLLEKLSPTYCIMCGVSSINALKNTIQNSNFTEVSFETFDKIGSIYPRIMKIKSKEEKIVHLIFIQHPSHHFSYNNWRNFIYNKFPEIIDQNADL